MGVFSVVSHNTSWSQHLQAPLGERFVPLLYKLEDFTNSEKGYSSNSASSLRVFGEHEEAEVI